MSKFTSYITKILLVSLVVPIMLLNSLSFAQSSLDLKDNQSALVSASTSTTAPASSSNSVSLNKCKKGKTMRIAVVQGGPFIDFVKILRQMVMSLSNWQYIDVDHLVDENFDFTAKDNYLKLAQASKGSCIEFIPDGFYDGQWDNELINERFSSLKRRIYTKHDIDMLWAFGSVAGRAFADSSFGIPVMVIATTDPESSGIIGPGEFSTLPNIHVQKEKDRYLSEIAMFYDIFRFKNLGVIVDKNYENQKAQGLDLVKDLAIKHNFDVTLCSGEVFKESSENKQTTLKRCALELAKECDAVYIPVGNAVNASTATNIQPLLDNGIPTFSQTGDLEVQYGVLLSMSDDSRQGAGIFEADVMRQIYEGKSPETISQYYFASLFLSLNLESAKIIGWAPSFEVLLAVDKVFPTIKRQ